MSLAMLVRGPSPPVTMVHSFSRRPPGYRIQQATFESFSETRASRAIDVSDPRKAVLNFSLRSGPWYDQYRGWLKGNFVVTLVPEKQP